MNEFVARKGLIARNDSQVTGSLSVTQNISASQYYGLEDSLPAGTVSSSVQIVTILEDGMTHDRQDLDLVATGSDIYMQVEKIGGGDMVYHFSSSLAITTNQLNEYTLDCTTGAGDGGKAKILLTAGASATSPQKNWIYVVPTGSSTAVLASSTAKPSGEYAMVATTVIPDATTFGTTGAYNFQRWTETLSHNGRGALAHEREKIRTLAASWDSGVVPSLVIVSGSDPDSVHLETSTGVVKQLHDQAWPSFSTGSYFISNGSTPYNNISDLNEILTDAEGTSLSGKYFSLVFWGSVSHGGESKLFVNLPNSSYSIENDAIIDTANTAVYSVPTDLKSTAFLIARVVLKHSPVSSGTWTLSSTIDLRGLSIGSIGGGVSPGTVANDFSDDLFTIYDDTDVTKIVRFQNSGITTGNTRTLTVPDADGVIALYGQGVVSGSAQISYTGITDVPTNTESATLYCVQSGSEVTVGDGVGYLTIPPNVGGMNLVSGSVTVVSTGTTGTTDIQIHNVTDAVDMLTTKITVDSGETSSATAATPYVIDTDNDDVAEGDLIRIDVDAVSSTAPTGLIVGLTFEAP